MKRSYIMGLLAVLVVTVLAIGVALAHTGETQTTDNQAQRQRDYMYPGNYDHHQEQHTQRDYMHAPHHMGHGCW